MIFTRLLISIALFLGLCVGFVVPNRESTGASPHLANDLTKLHPMNRPNLLTCRNTNQRMSCYGGPPVTLDTCREVCTCENGRIICPTYKFCDDETMDTFCAGLCACASSLPNKLRANEGDTMISAHRYHRLIDEEEEADEEDEGLLRRHARQRRDYSESDASGVAL
ncbi:hypothetical protein B0A52_04922 [Exophiala mesophila]|uniref:Uncharacterized protein n=1 Tax=Exophiala mesophila TaxID=212818 RepID=A0A438N6J6_EXOME|nr:hypothetical protein B0A52_04922 [Exophiala mesophila]